MNWRWLMAFIQSSAFTCQSAHFFAGWAVTLTASHWMGWWAPVAFLGLWCCPKELLFDYAPWGENHGSPDWLDLTFYTLGTAVACWRMSAGGL